VEILCRIVALESSRRSTFTGNMGSSGASKIPIRETIDGEVLPLVALDEALVAEKETWDLDSALSAFAQATASGVFKMPIPADIDPKGDYAVRTADFRPAQSPPTATPTTPVAVPEPVAMLIVLGDMKVHHERSPEEPPAHFLEGEDDSDEDQAGRSTPELPRKRARMVAAGNLATLGLAEEGFTFGSVLEPLVPAGPAKK